MSATIGLVLTLLAPGEGRGRVLIPVTLPSDLVACKVMAVSEIHERCNHGTVKVSVMADGAEPLELFLIIDGRNDEYHDISEWVKGKSSFKIVAEVEEILHPDTENNTDRIFSWHARFLLSVKDRSRNVLHVKGYRLVPAPDANKAWAEAR